MSNQLTTLVTVFDGTNFTLWSCQMRAYLQSQGLWGFCTGDIPKPSYHPAVKAMAYIPADPVAKTPEVKEVKAQNEYTPSDTKISAWHKQDDQALGHIILRLSAAIQQNLDSSHNAEDLWQWLENTYETDTLSSVYKDLREVLNTRFLPNQHPTPVFEKLEAAYLRLNDIQIGPVYGNLNIQPTLQGLIALTNMPKEWEDVVTIINLAMSIQTISLKAIQPLVVNHYEMKHSIQSGKSHQATKISVVKRKRDQPISFKKQQEGQQQRSPGSGSSSKDQQQHHKQRGSRGSGHGKGKGKQRPAGHSHIASMVVLTPALPPPTLHTIAHIGPSSITTRTVTEEAGSSRTPGLYPSVNHALSLAERLGVTPTTQTVKMLEERLGDFDTLVQVNHYDEFEDLDVDIDMSWPAKHHSSELTLDGHEDVESIGEQTLSAFESLSMTDDYSEIGFSDKENRVPTPPYIDPWTVDCGGLKEQLMDVVGLTLGLLLDDTKRYPLQDITPSLSRKCPHLSKKMCQNGATLLDEEEVTLDSSFIEPGMTCEDIQALQYAHMLSQDRNFIHPNEVE